MSSNPLRIVVDSREQLGYAFSRYSAVVQTAALPVGDYSLLGFEDRIAIERKSLDDLIGCLMGKDRDRFERELAKARGLEFFAVVVEAGFEDINKHHYRSKMTPRSAYQSLAAFMIRYPLVRFLFAGSREGAEYLTFSLLEKYRQEIEKRFFTLRKTNAA